MTSEVLTWAEFYVRQGWPVLLLVADSARGKIPPGNCPRCDSRASTYVHHDKATCECLLCHGFHAATTDLERVRAMIDAVPNGYLAVRTGGRSGGGSGLLVVDAEASDDDSPGTTGLDVLDQWESWVGGWSLPRTLTARTVSGGLHLLYRLPEPEARVTSGRVLPNVDVKGESGYVGVPCGRDGRRWVDPAVDVAEAPRELLDWLAGRARRGTRGSSRGGNGGGGDGRGLDYDYDRFAREGCPGGHRDVFFNDLLFRLRKAGVTQWAAAEEARRHWERCAQPPSARWHMPWSDVEYKLGRIWREVQTESLSDAETRWVRGTVARLHPKRLERIRVSDRRDGGVVRRGRSGFGHGGAE